MASAVMKPGAVLDMAHAYFPQFLEQRRRVGILDSWHRGEQNASIFMPDNAEPEYGELVSKSPTPWAGLVVTSMVQNCELVGMRMPGSEENVSSMASWQRNQMDARQPALYRAATAHGQAFVVDEIGIDPFTGEKRTRMRLVSAHRMAAFYDEDDDEWPKMAMQADPYREEDGGEGWTVQMYDDIAVYHIRCKGDGTTLDQWTFVTYELHGSRVTPVVRYAPMMDIDGRTNSMIEPLIPLLARIDQDTFDRLIVQRFGAWKVRYIAGMVRPKNDQERRAAKLRLRVEDLLIAEDKDTKFGTLDATDLAGFIASRDSDLRDLSAVSQTPPHHMLGLSSNLQAESLAAAEAGLQRKSREARTAFGESHEQLMRLDAHLRGEQELAAAYQLEARWRDTESRSLEQAAMALGMLATSLKVPVQMLWERIPGWTDLDVVRAKKAAESQGIDDVLAELESKLTQAA